MSDTMKTDRELLELAAKAAGLNIHIWGTKGSENCSRRDCDVNQAWNPLTDDGDALRLAVGLHMSLHLPDWDIWAQSDAGTFSGESGDAYAATRRAITRAAAAIGESM